MKQYLYGKQPVLMRLQREQVNHLYLLEDSPYKEAVTLAKQKGVPITYLPRKKLDQIIKGNHQGVIAEIEAYKTYDLEELLSSVPQGDAGLIIMVDGVSDPHNLGAIMRTADAVGAHGIIIKKHHAVGLTSVVAKVSAGAIDNIKVAVVANLTTTAKHLKDQGYWIFGTDMVDATHYRHVDYTVNSVIVVGSEGDGISRLLKQQCDHMVYLPMVGTVTSLNVSVATAILLYEVLHQRQVGFNVR